jgi:hypothetical protein
MRSAGNFSPEWGYLAPAPSFLRTARVVLVATAVGATAGAAVVLSLVDRPAAEANKTPIAARAIVTSVHAASVATVVPSVPPPVVAAVAAPGNVMAAPDAKPPLDVKANAVLPAKPQIPAQAVPQMRAEAPAQPRPQPPVTVQPVANASVPAAAVAVTPTAVATVPAAATGIAALSPAPVAAPETATSDTPDLTIAAPEPALPQKKAKHAATKTKTEPGLGSVLKRLFSAATNKQSVH